MNNFLSESLSIITNTVLSTSLVLKSSECIDDIKISPGCIVYTDASDYIPTVIIRSVGKSRFLLPPANIVIKPSSASYKTDLTLASFIRECTDLDRECSIYVTGSDATFTFKTGYIASSKDGILFMSSCKVNKALIKSGKLIFEGAKIELSPALFASRDTNVAYLRKKIIKYLNEDMFYGSTEKGYFIGDFPYDVKKLIGGTVNVESCPKTDRKSGVIITINNIDSPFKYLKVRESSIVNCADFTNTVYKKIEHGKWFSK